LLIRHEAAERPRFTRLAAYAGGYFAFAFTPPDAPLFRRYRLPADFFFSLPMPLMSCLFIC